LGSERRSDEIGILNEKQLPKEMTLALTMLAGGTPVVLYGEEINLNQVCLFFLFLFLRNCWNL